MQTLTPGLRTLITIGSTVLLVAALYLARSVLIPVALAVMITFLLGPIVDRFDRLRIGNVAPVILVLLFALVVVVGTGWLVVRQATDLVARFPEQRGTILAKIESVRAGEQSAFLRRLMNNVDDMRTALSADHAGSATVVESKPLPVEVKDNESGFTAAMPVVLGFLAHVGFVFLLTCFMLLRRRELRDRLIRLIGDRDLPLMTKALDETADRISQYLFAQCVINAVDGILVAIGLALLGVPYAALFGILTAILRFIPYLGVWTAALPPLLTSFASADGWSQSLMVLGLFATVEVVTYMIVEPIVYSKSIGVSSVALLIAIAAWTALWGPAGLLLAAPITVCLAVAGRNVPQLRFIDTLIGSDPVMNLSTRYYQRLLARDPDEAMQVVDEYLKGEAEPESVYDEVLIPTLSWLRQDAGRTGIDERDVDYILGATTRIVELIAIRQKGVDLKAGIVEPESPPVEFPRMIGFPALDAIDSAALGMLQQLMPAAPVKMVSDDVLSSELLDLVAKHDPRIVFVASCPPGGVTQCRYIVKRLRSRSPHVHIVIGSFGLVRISAHDEELLKKEGADAVVTSLLDARKQILNVIDLASTSKEPGDPEHDLSDDSTRAAAEPTPQFANAESAVAK